MGGENNLSPEVANQLVGIKVFKFYYPVITGMLSACVKNF
jgi:hypothetical protein